MAHFIQKNAGGALNRGTYFYNDGGVVKRPGRFFYNIGGEVIKFPKFEKCVFNLDGLTWLGGNSSYNANSFIDKDLYNFDVDNVNTDMSLTRLQGKIANTVNNVTSINDSTPDTITPQYRFLGMSRRQYGKIFTLKQGRFGEGGKITFHIKIKMDRAPDASWWNPIIFKNNWNARLEIGTNRTTDFNFYTEGNQACPAIEAKWNNGDILQNAQCATIVIDSVNRSVSYYINGKNVGNVGCNFGFDPVNSFTIQNRRGGAQYLAPVRYYSVRIWNDALSWEEVRDICKIDGSYHP